jgi:hypothetical protein
MEPVLLLVGLCALGVLAIRFGRDSRESIHSKEQTMAKLGVVWDGVPGDAPKPSPRRPAHRLRHSVAGLLYRLSDWLYPEVSEPRRLPHSRTAM